jgi:hypothetical protein
LQELALLFARYDLAGFGELEPLQLAMALEVLVVDLVDDLLAGRRLPGSHHPSRLRVRLVSPRLIGLRFLQPVHLSAIRAHCQFR